MSKGNEECFRSDGLHHAMQPTEFECIHSVKTNLAVGGNMNTSGKNTVLNLLTASIVAGAMASHAVANAADEPTFGDVLPTIMDEYVDVRALLIPV
jgi:hypothetical protein